MFERCARHRKDLTVVILVLDLRHLLDCEIVIYAVVSLGTTTHAGTSTQYTCFSDVSGKGGKACAVQSWTGEIHGATPFDGRTSWRGLRGSRRRKSRLNRRTICRTLSRQSRLQLRTHGPERVGDHESARTRDGPAQHCYQLLS